MSEKKKICVITGCNTGIGKATAIGMAQRGYKVVMLVRDSEKSRSAFKEIIGRSNSDDVEMFFVDMSSKRSIISCVDRMKTHFKTIDVLINNAGVVKRKKEMSIDGIEITMAVNYFAPFILTNLLLPMIKNSDGGRIVNLTSELYKKGTINFDDSKIPSKFNGNKAYSDSKLLLILFTKELANRLSKDGITVNCIHPGVAGSEAFREYPKLFNVIMNLFIATPDTVAEPVIRLATESQFDNTSGQYFYRSTVRKTNNLASSEEMQKKAWKTQAT